MKKKLQEDELSPVPRYIALPKLLPLYVFIAMLCFGLVYFSIKIVSEYDFLGKLIYSPSNFGDFWLHVNAIQKFGLRRVYEGGMDYCFPPLSYLYYAVFFRMCSRSSGTLLFSLSQMGILISVIRTSILSVLLCVGLQKALKKTNIYLCMLFCIALLISIPFWLAIERGNSSFEVLVLLLLALQLKEERHPAYREIALFLIAIAANFKLYPALFGLLYLRERRFKEALRLIIYGVLLFILPFLVIDGWAGFTAFFRNITSVVTIHEPSHTNINGFMHILVGKTGMETGVLGKIVTALYTALVLIVLFTRKQDWKTLLLLTSLIIVVPMKAYGYTSIYLVIPLTAFLNNCASEDPTIINIVRSSLYSVLFGIIFFGYYAASQPAIFSIYTYLYIMLLIVLVSKLFERSLFSPRRSPVSG